MYGKLFSSIYNEFGWNYYPEAFGEQLLRWISDSSRTIRTCLDMGCGTGVLCEILTKAGINARGMDLSEDMIAIARSRNPKIAYDVADMVTYDPGLSFDLITCTGDALNHIADLSSIETIFHHAYHMLNPGGCLLFDLLNEREAEECGPIDIDYSDSIKGQFTIRREPNQTVHLTVAVYENGILQCEEHIRETLHESEAITSLLKKAGFTGIDCRHNLPGQDAHEALTWFVLAEKGRNV